MLSDSYIHLDEHRVSRQQMIPYRIRFELNEANLSQINIAKKNNKSIQLECDRLTNIRYYALLVFYADPNSELVFTTNYLQESEQKTVINSAIAASGKISQEIREDSLQNPQLFNNIVKAHHWSISEIIRHLPIKHYRFAKWIPAIIALLITIIVVPLVMYFVPIFYLFQLLIILIFSVVLYLLLEFILIARIKKIVLYQLLFGWLGISVKKRRIGFKLLTFLGGS